MHTKTKEILEGITCYKELSVINKHRVCSFLLFVRSGLYYLILTETLYYKTIINEDPQTDDFFSCITQLD